jgi:F-type H+-transporting ATPase subunit a
MIAAVEDLIEIREAFRIGPVTITETVVVTWAVMAFLIVVAAVVRLRLSQRRPGALQIVVEGLVTWVDTEIRNIVGGKPDRYFPLIATLFVFILTLNLASNLPGVKSPTGDLSTTAGLAIFVVFLVVPFYGIAAKGFLGYLRTYIRPTPLLLPFNIIGEFSRVLSLAVRLFANVMSGGLIVGVLISLVPLVAPMLMMALGLITGVVQAYVFPVLAMVYIGGVVRLEQKREMQRAEETA